MSKYLKKLKEGISVKGNYNLNQIYNCDGIVLGCGNRYKEGLKHEFYSDDNSDITLLINIIRRFKFKTIITNITKNSFEFESETENEQIFFFRICRYVRTEIIKKVLKDTIIINKSGVKIQNAFLLAHYYNYTNGHCMSIKYFNQGFDPFFDVSDESNLRLNKPYKLLKDFKLNFDKTIIEHQETDQSFMSLFRWTKSNFNVEKKFLFELLKKEDFKASEKYLLKVYK